jgi:uncharacterized protein YbaR (Trm112 family)
MTEENNKNIEDIIDILACLKCKGDLMVQKSKLICKRCKKEYKIVNGVPIFLKASLKDKQK